MQWHWNLFILVEVFAEHSCLLQTFESQTRSKSTGSETTETSRPYYDLLVIVPSHFSDTKGRSAVRQSWGRYLNQTGHCPTCKSPRTVKIIFGLGGKANHTSIALEGGQDLAFLGASDEYGKLTEKIRRLITYALQHYRFALLLKVDTDSFVFMDRLLKTAEAQKLFEEKNNVYAGHFIGLIEPIVNMSDRDAKWADFDYSRLTGQKLLPKYAGGFGYFLGPSLCRYLANHGKALTDLPALLPLANEDVAIGFWLQPVKHLKVFLYISPTADGCRRKKMIIDHKITPKRMLNRWEKMMNRGDPCFGERNWLRMNPEDESFKIQDGMRP